MDSNKFWLLGIVLLIIFIGITAAAHSQAGQEITRFEENKPLPGAILYDQNGEFIKRLGKGKVFVSSDQISPDLFNAIDVTQAKDFNKEQNSNAPRFQSTVQRLSNVIIEPNGIWSGFKARFLPSILKRRYSKQELTTMYLNHANFGSGILGVEAASQVYLGKPVEQIELWESALLAAIAWHPEDSSPLEQSATILQTRNNVLAHMRKRNHIDLKQYEHARNKPLDLEHHESGRAHHFSDYLNKRLSEELGDERILQGGLQIETTLNMTWQQAAETILQETGLQGALVAINPQNGSISVMVGGPDYFQDKDNLATSLQKHVGTILRPLIYAAGLKEGWAMNHIVQDIAREFPGEYRVKNAGERYWGHVTMKHALKMDLHNAAIWTLNELGIEKFATLAETLQIRLEPQDRKLNLAMGEISEGISLLELTQAYLPNLTEGVFFELTGYVQVKDSEKQVILKEQKESRRVFTPQQAYLLTDMLSTTPASTNARNLGLDFPVAIATSTSQDNKTQWCIGYTPALLVGVVLKLPEQTTDNSLPSTLAEEIWAQFITEIQKESDHAEFVVPEDIETGILIDVFSGLLANKRCPQVEIDAFIEGTQPTEMAPCAIPPASPAPQTAPAPSTPTPSITTSPAAPGPPAKPEPEPPEQPPKPSKPEPEQPEPPEPSEPEPEPPEPAEPSEPEPEPPEPLEPPEPTPESTETELEL